MSYESMIGECARAYVRVHVIGWVLCKRTLPLFWIFCCIILFDYGVIVSP